MRKKQALKRYKERQRKEQRRMISDACLYNPIPRIYEEKKETKKVFSHYSLSKEMSLHVDEKFIQREVDHALAKGLGYELLKHSQIEHHEDVFGQSWLAILEVVE